MLPPKNRGGSRLAGGSGGAETTDEELEATARAAEVQSMKKQCGLTALTPDGIHAQLQEQRLAGLRAVLAKWGTPANNTKGTHFDD
jgi:hypothetical protein